MPTRTRSRALFCMEPGGVYVPRSRRPVLEGPEAVAMYLFTLYPRKFPQEAFMTLLVDPRHRVERAVMVSLGTLSSALVHPRDVFAPAILHRSLAIILSHNHPSGDPEPSQEDFALTTSLVKAGRLLGIEVLDHLVLGSDGKKRWCSMKASHSTVFETRKG